VIGIRAGRRTDALCEAAPAVAIGAGGGQTRPVAWRRAVLGLIVGSLVVAGCGSGRGTGSGAEGAGGGPAAGPAAAPSDAVVSAGVRTKIGPQAEGMAYDDVTGLLAIAVREPDRILLINPVTGTQTTVGMPGHSRHLQLAGPGGPLLVPVEDANVLVRVELPSGTTKTTPVGTQPHDAAGLDGGRVVVGDEFSKQISILDAQGKVERTVDDLVQPGGIVGAGPTVAVIDVGGFTLSTYDVGAGTRTGRLPAGQGPTHGVLTKDRHVVVVDTRGGALMIFALDPLAQLTRYALDGSPYGMAYDAATNTVWVTLTKRNELVGLNLDGPTPVEIARYATVEQPNSVAVVPGSSTVWVGGTRDGVLQTIAR
jgi:DNA-binding beta-propeller fold protein YncE